MLGGALSLLHAINGRKFSDDVLREEVRAAKGGSSAILVSVELGSATATFAVDDHSGERWPHLERIENTPDLLAEIMRPRGK